MKNHARNALIALLALMFILSITRFAKAVGPSINLPPGTVSATYNNPGSNSYWDIKLSNVPSGYDITNGTYTGWCNDETHYINNGETLDGVTLYSSYDQIVYLGDWNRVNYIINHPQGLWQDVQDAIWYYIDGHNMPSSQAGINMVNDANANGGGFEPAPGQLLAVVVWDAGYQTTFIAVTVPAQLTVNNGGHGAASGQGSYPAGTPAIFDITPTTVSGGTGVQYIFTGWSSSDTGGYTGPLSTNSVMMNNNITETAIWQTQYQLTVNSAHGTVLGAGWYTAGTTGVPFSVSPTTVSGGTGIQYVFTGWTSSDSGGYTGAAPSSTVTMSNLIVRNYVSPEPAISGAAPSSTVTMSNPITETANWKMQYQLTVNNGGHGTTSGAGWYDAGSPAAFSISPTKIPVTGTVLQDVFTGWSSSDTHGYVGVASSNSVTMNNPITEMASWITQNNFSVGGEWAPISMQVMSPINAVQLLAPWIALALIAAATAVAGYRRFLKKRW